jgi:hypothetical protein
MRCNLPRAELKNAMATNIRAARARAPEGETLRRYEAVARLLTGKPDAVPEEGAEWVRHLCGELQIPPLSSYGIQERDVLTLVEEASSPAAPKAIPSPYHG